MSDLLDLAARCERATEADRLMDAAIAEALTGEPAPDGAVWQGTPRYTASLDAAMSLVPEDYHAELRGLNDAWFARVDSTVDASTVSARSNARCAALALCAAALRARAGLAHS